jgi:hypothetical protein
VLFEFYDKLKPVVARFDQAQASTDGGAVLLTALDDRLRVTDQLAACLVDRRDPDKIRHSVRDLLRQRIFGLACGYEDGNDAARLADDPLHKLAVGRDPVTGAPLASQPTLYRFEHAMSPRALYRGYFHESSQSFSLKAATYFQPKQPPIFTKPATVSE